MIAAMEYRRWPSLAALESVQVNTPWLVRDRQCVLQTQWQQEPLEFHWIDTPDLAAEADCSPAAAAMDGAVVAVDFAD